MRGSNTTKDDHECTSHDVGVTMLASTRIDPVNGLACVIDSPAIPPSPDPRDEMLEMDGGARSMGRDR